MHLCLRLAWMRVAWLAVRKDHGYGVMVDERASGTNGKGGLHRNWDEWDEWNQSGAELEG